ncbi:MAG: hypothetical protein A3J74_03710 [Elusimicrobia bacterium RIFCSPHIGHO2_02_FULL_57_9]|nr:MAG: hypothetical protein A3J74_03710 [Elusimicrobia bacterium RIFCSPHIGHO2_02_FULL_57_9]
MESELKKAVQEVAAAAKGLNLDIVLVGALMAEFSPEIEADYPRFRRTNDADFAVYARDWPTYKKLRDALLEKEFKPNPKIEHRLHHGTAMVDLLPYGSQIAPDGKLAWPESGFEMTVTGFDEACAEARKSASSKDVDMPVITAPGFVLLKIIAYLDRKERAEAKHRDDAKDIAYWLHNYAGGTKDERRFALANGSDLTHQDYETAGAVLLGKEVGALTSTEAAAYVDRFLRESEDRYSPFIDVLAAGEMDEASDKKRGEGLALLAAFEKGYQHARKQR